MIIMIIGFSKFPEFIFAGIQEFRASRDNEFAQVEASIPKAELFLSFEKLRCQSVSLRVVRFGVGLNRVEPPPK